jgi:hypothetical protein
MAKALRNPPPDPDDFGSFEDLLKKVPRPIQGIIIYSRMGGHLLNWGTAGASRYSAVSAVIQIGSSQWTGAAAASGQVSPTYGYAFGHTPLVIASPVCNPIHDVSLQVWPSPGYCRFSWFSHDGNLTSLTIHWIAIGTRSVASAE